MSDENDSFANLTNLPALEELYQKYLQDPQSVDPSWRHFFQGMAFAQSGMPKFPVSQGKESLDLRVYLLIDAYRKFGHLMAKCNPLLTAPIAEPEELKIEKLGFKPEDLEALFPTCGFLKEKEASLKTLIEALQKTYCGSIGIEYMGLGSVERERWIQEKIEPFFPLNIESQQKLKILHDLNKAELFESFLHMKYVGQKRFSLEGGETMIPMLNGIIDKGAQLGIEEAVLGISHRGRLNVLANILNMSYTHIFQEFEDYYTPDLIEGTGDVKYHKGYVGALPTSSGKAVVVTVAANPSHLEAVDPVVEGIARAKQELKGFKEHGHEILPIMIHGDAAMAGQGVVYETIQLSGLNGYKTGGTIHLVINNQIGFTTLPKDTRSTRYCTEIARAFDGIVFHVNAEDPESCMKVAELAIELRQLFRCDVFIDLICYRKYGHNESDEPTFTQPLEYAIIRSKRSVREIFRERLIQSKELDPQEAERLEVEFKTGLQKALENIPKVAEEQTLASSKREKKISNATTVVTAVEEKELIRLAEKFCSIPEGLKIHPKIQKLQQERLNMVKANPEQKTIDWGMGELLAYASLLQEKIHVRISGQDVRRGTFSHRHAIWVDQVKEFRYFPLSHISQDQAPCDVYNSPLSEYAVLGFEFGYSIAYPQSLVIWEAQFGDFANGAQIIIDQFITSSEQKWNFSCNLTLFLPHGYEGQGPEHSSARMERFLQLCSNENMRIVNCSTPAQLFHLLRSQGKLNLRRPLILFTPKALLRHPACLSSLTDFAKGHFQPVIDDPAPPAKPSRLFFCSGKVYYEFSQEKQKRNNTDIALIRLEQLYPFPKEQVEQILKKYEGCTEIVWIQEEHQNMGAWEYISFHFQELLGAKKTLTYMGRNRSASTAAGSHTLHKKQWEEILQNAFKPST